MAEGVIHTLEMVDVAEDYAHRLVLPARSLQFPQKHSENLSAIHQSGEAIVSGGAAHGLARGNQFLLQVENPLTDQEARLQFQLIKGLHQIVVRTGLHGVEHVLTALFAGEKDDINVWTGRSGLPNALAKLNAIQIGQHPIEQNELGGTRLLVESPSLGAGLGKGERNSPA